MAKKIKVKLILELRASQISQREICRTRKISPHSVGEVYKIANKLNITYFDVKDKSDDEVYRLFYPDKYLADRLYQSPDYTSVHTKLKETGVTLKLLWQAYKDSADSLATSYTRYCEGYSKYVTANNLINHLHHKPGVLCEVGWSESTMTLVDRTTGEFIKAYVFVATLPYSQYSYMEPCLDRTQDTWLKCHKNMFEFFCGSTVRITYDHLKPGVISHPREEDIILNKKYEELGRHYLTAIMPTGIRKPKQKASVKGVVGIIAKLRNKRFHSITELKLAVSKQLDEFNKTSYEKREGSRFEVFHDVEKKYLRELPSVPYEIVNWSYNQSVGIDSRVVYKTNRYSAPYSYIGKKVDLKVTDSLVEIYYKNERICRHKKKPVYENNKWSTHKEHMSDQFHHTNWDDIIIKNWASSIGPCTSEVIDRILANMQIIELGYDLSLSVLRLSKTYSDERLEVACELALDQFKSPGYRTLKAILNSNQDKVFLSQKSKVETRELNKTIKGYVRRSEYYSEGE